MQFFADGQILELLFPYSHLGKIAGILTTASDVNKTEDVLGGDPDAFARCRLIALGAISLH